MGVDGVESVVLQKLRSLLVDESFTSNRIKGRLERMQRHLEKTRTSLDEASATVTNDEEIKNLRGEYLGCLYSMEDSIEKFALRFTRRRKRLGFLINHALFLNKFTALNVLGYKLHSIRMKVRELDRRTSSLRDTLEYENADDDGTAVAGEGTDDPRSCMKRTKSNPSFPTTTSSSCIVLDGLGSWDQWISLEEAYPEPHQSKTILTTTCDDRVEHEDSKWHSSLKLGPEESWTLFLRKVALQEEPEDSALKNKIIDGCQGQPLNLLLLGSLLSTKEKANWHETLDTLDRHEKWQLSNILKVSYNDLDTRLKLCLIYMTLFPKELDIPVRRLKRLWLAEGFVEQKQSESREDVAQKHFEDLVKRSLIVISKQRSDGSPRKCRLLGALHNHLSTEARDISLFHVHTKPGPDCQRDGSFSNRRLIEHACAEPCPLEPSKSKLLRSYISFNYQKKDTPAKYVSSLVSKMVGKGLGLLRVLDLEGVYRPSLPENLGDLFHLRYLGLRWTFLDKLPKSVGELPYLETVDLKHTCIDKIPSSIWKLRKLQHLNLHQVHLDKDTPLHSTNSLPELLSLWGLTVSSESPITNGLSKLKRLRELGISFRLIDAAEFGSKTPAQSTITLVEWISKLKDLRQLRLRSIDDAGRAADLTLMPFSKLEMLSHMKLLGKLQQLPRIGEFPPQIKVLTLSLSYLNEDPMPTLGHLQSLTVLRLLGNSYIGDTMVCKSNTFKNLEVLKLWVLQDLKKFEVEDGAMEALKEVNIRRCCKLQHFPSRVLRQKTFKILILNDMPPAFKENIHMDYQSKVYMKDFGSS